VSCYIGCGVPIALPLNSSTDPSFFLQVVGGATNGTNNNCHLKSQVCLNDFASSSFEALTLPLELSVTSFSSSFFIIRTGLALYSFVLTPMPVWHDQTKPPLPPALPCKRTLRVVPLPKKTWTSASSSGETILLNQRIQSAVSDKFAVNRTMCHAAPAFSAMPCVIRNGKFHMQILK
jgi:hypothetical protein